MKHLLLVTLAVLTVSACDNTNTTSDIDSINSKETDIPDASDPAPVDTETATAMETDDTETVVPQGQLGERCWIEEFPSGHPNLGLEDCEPALSCIGDKDDGWCSASCTVTGALSDDEPIDGWCCGELGGACDPTRVWMPESMNAACVPREIPLGEPCEPSGESRCKPLCEGEEVTFHVACTSTPEERFCSHMCESHLDCIENPVFSEGCCASLMGATYCQPNITDACISN